MKNQPLFLAMVMAGGFSFVAAGCILGDDPNHNSMLYGAQAGSSGTAGNNGTAGTNGGGGSTLEMLPGTPVATFAARASGSSAGCVAS